MANVTEPPKTKPDDFGGNGKAAFAVPAWAAAGPNREPIAVHVLRFSRPTDLPGAPVVDSLKAGGPPNQRRWIIDFLPWARLFRVVYVDPSRPGEEKTAYVHESQPVSWEPA